MSDTAGPTTLAPEIRGEVPGPASRALAERLAAVETRDVTCLTPVPIFWERSAGANVWDVDGNRFIDLTGAFGVSSVGHSRPEVAGAVAEQARKLLHGMGDVHPSDVKVALLEELCRRFPGGEPARATLLSSGADAVETALKTAILARGTPGVIAFRGAYHGLSLGALDATERSDFRDPFRARLPDATRFANYGDLEDVERVALDSKDEIGAVLVEPVQGRGGERVPPPGFLSGLRALCDRHGWLLIADEIYTGCGRTGRFFAVDHEGVVPDLLCVGKGLASGMPISACLGRAEVMDAWPTSRGEALHTQTFLGHPPSCAAALATLALIDEEKLVTRAAELGAVARNLLAERTADHPAVAEVRGLGLMLGIACHEPADALASCARALRSGVILLPSGPGGSVLSITPPLVIDRDALLLALEILVESLP